MFFSLEEIAKPHFCMERGHSARIFHGVLLFPPYKKNKGVMFVEHYALFFPPSAA